MKIKKTSENRNDTSTDTDTRQTETEDLSFCESFKTDNTGYTERDPGL